MTQPTFEEIQALNYNHVLERGTPEALAEAVEYLRFFGWVCVGGISTTISPFPNGQGNYVQSYSVLMENPMAYARLAAYKAQNK